MSQLVYKVVEHDGGWAYTAKGVYSETFPSHDAAVKAAERVAAEQTQSGETAEIEYEDQNSKWKTEHADGHDRPKTSVIE